MSRRSRLPKFKKKSAQFLMTEALAIEDFLIKKDLSFSQVCRQLFRQYLAEQNSHIDEQTDNNIDATSVRSIGFD